MRITPATMTLENLGLAESEWRQRQTEYHLNDKGAALAASIRSEDPHMVKRAGELMGSDQLPTTYLMLAAGERGTRWQNRDKSQRRIGHGRWRKWSLAAT